MLHIPRRGAWFLPCSSLKFDLLQGKRGVALVGVTSFWGFSLSFGDALVLITSDPSVRDKKYSTTECVRAEARLKDAPPALQLEVCTRFFLLFKYALRICAH